MTSRSRPRRNESRRRATAVAIAALSIVACSRDRNDGDSARAGSTVAAASPSATTLAPPVSRAPTPATSGSSRFASFCAAAYDAELEALRATCSPDELQARRGAASSAAPLCARDLATLVAGGRVTFDGVAAAECIAEIKATHDRAAVEGEPFFTRDRCDRVVLGLRREGESCRWPPECEDGLTCDGSAEGVEGVCRKLAPIGAKCTAQAFGTVFDARTLAARHGPCMTGAYCAAGKCTALGVDGSACAHTAECGRGLHCDAASSRCTKRKTADAACLR